MSRDDGLATALARMLRYDAVGMGRCVCGAEAEIKFLTPGFTVPVFDHKEDCPIVLAGFTVKKDDIIEFSP